MEHLLKILNDRIDFGRISSFDFLYIFLYSRVRTDHAKFRAFDWQSGKTIRQNKK